KLAMQVEDETLPKEVRDFAKLLNETVKSTKGDIAECLKTFGENLEQSKLPSGKKQVEELARTVGGLINDVESLKPKDMGNAGQLTILLESKAGLKELGEAFEQLSTTPGGHKEMTEHLGKLTVLTTKLEKLSERLEEHAEGDGPQKALAKKLGEVVDKTLE